MEFVRRMCAEQLDQGSREERDQHEHPDEHERDQRDLVVLEPPPEELQRRPRGDLVGLERSGLWKQIVE